MLLFVQVHKLFNPLNSAYDVWLLRISESPASMIAIVEHLKSFPHAVPNSICKVTVSAYDSPSKASRLRLFRRVCLQDSDVLSLAEYVSTHVISRKVMDICLSKPRLVSLSDNPFTRKANIEHAIIFELALPKWWGVASDDNKLGLARAKGFER